MSNYYMPRVYSVYVPRQSYAKSFEVVCQAAAEAPMLENAKPKEKQKPRAHVN